ncbi:5-formyltetrahydrofolate cyclo-ligase [Dethiosulfatibacter aminovorans DSM 17477]|uniref:5-formyltetrahydrofolate cyclo-ligase n=1 Tax=Dethiosulfatibacter aminovorans DSM 17477 TaxID=1121476 RepID=A0A1M6IB01_9FIRM|nr:5-formyltetrahydrofolate cyclo-ligase [Dethiosulfatibacter aminovorans]SHJ31621.1 5-formyltetrahydrofolate cyclo-ligase [Dethiosulfatibacter aminovorans DSM 17477]
MESKKEIRKRILKKRREMDPAEAAEKSALIFDRITGLEEFRNAATVGLYLSFDNEVDTFELLKLLKESGKRIVVTYTESREVVLIPVYINDIENDFVEGAWGYLEPKVDQLETAAEEDLDFVVVPGVVFDEERNRVGFGKGYYDKYLSKLRDDAVTAAMAYEYQVLEKVPAESHDIKMKIIVTEDRIIR